MRKITTQIPGPKSKILHARERKHLAPGLQRFATLAGIAVKKAEGSLITDVDGNRYIDMIGGIGVNGLGHSHPKWITAIRRQLKKISVGSFTSLPRLDLLKRLSKHRLSKNLDQVQLYSGGSEAVESALRLAKSYTKKHEFIGFWGAFHGKTLGSLSLMGINGKAGFGPLAQGSYSVPYANCYRCPLKLKHPQCGLACVEVARNQIRNQTSGSIAAFVVEPMQGAGGNIIPPKDYLPAIASLAKEKEALLIVDEMITGFGRTGRYWGCDHSGIKPDILTIGKQFGGGLPISGLITRREIAKAEPWSHPSGSSSSYGGNPLSSAAAAATLRIIDEEDLTTHSRKMGTYFLNKLLPMMDRFPFVGEVRGEGLFLGIELVKCKKSKEPLSDRITVRLFQELLKRGLLTMAYESRFRMQPAMTIDEPTLDSATDAIYEVFEKVHQNQLWKR